MSRPPKYVDIGNIRICPTCSRSLELSETNFTRHKHVSTGFNAECRDCKKTRGRNYYKIHERKIRQKVDKWYCDNLEYANYHKKRRNRLQRYGLSEEQYQQMLNEHKGLCAICKEAVEKLCIDHDHVTGKVRGLLCDPCNNGLGRFRDSVLYLQGAIEYLQKN